MEQDAAEPLPSIDNEIVKHVMEVFQKKTQRESISILLNTNEVQIWDSKFGGIPYIPRKQAIPTNKDGQCYRFLAQIRMDDLPKQQIGFPHEGMLQFWLANDELFGLDGDYEVIYYSDIDETVTQEDIKNKNFIIDEDDTFFPIQDEFGLSFILEMEAMTIADYQFDETFIKIWNEEYPQIALETYMDLEDSQVDMIYDVFSECGHRMGGYPYFTQSDMRENDMQDYQVLLLQIDTDEVEGKEIIWGDCGVANFFMTQKDLENLDFSKVFFTWDCC